MIYPGTMTLVVAFRCRGKLARKFVDKPLIAAVDGSLKATVEKSGMRVMGVHLIRSAGVPAKA